MPPSKISPALPSNSRITIRPPLSGAHTVIVETMRTETRLRNLAWMEEKRRRVEEATKGQVGYIYVRSTGVDGQNELIRQFTAQLDKKALDHRRTLQ